MKISRLLNQVIYGHQIDSWNYDESMPLEELQKNGFPYSMACIEINENSIVAVDVGEEAPIDYIRENQYKEFILDPSKHPRNIDSMLGNKNVFYLKEYTGEFEKNDYQWTQFTINGFKENGTFSGAPVNGSFSPMTVDMAFTQIQKKLNNVRDGIEVYDLEEKDIGSFLLQVDFLNNDESIPDKYYKTTLKTAGFSYKEIIELVQHIYDNIPPERK